MADTPVPPGVPVTALADIEGLWLIERFGAFEPGWRNDTGWRQAFVQFGADHATYKIGCNQSGNPVALGPDAILRDTGDGSRMQTLVGCAPEQMQRDGALFGYFGTGPKVERIGADRLRLTSAAGELVLVTPEAWRIANAPALATFTGRWVPQMVMRYDGWGHSGYGLETPGVMTIGQGGIAWSGCGGIAADGDWTDDARFVAQGAVRGTCPASEDGGNAIRRALGAQPAVIRTGPSHIVLVAGNTAIHMTDEELILNPPPPPPVPDWVRIPEPPPPPPPPPSPSPPPPTPTGRR